MASPETNETSVAQAQPSAKLAPLKAARGYQVVEYVSRSELLGYGLDHVNERLEKVAQATRRSPAGSTFLSHSSRDDEVMPGVVRILENHGAHVYLDKKDPTLTSKTPQQIAAALRQRVSVCKKFVLFASNYVKDSKWVPWELGLADGYRTPENVCLFPAPDKSSEFRWTEQEYLGIYDRIVWNTFEGNDKAEWMVWNFSKNTGSPLRRWLSS